MLTDTHHLMQQAIDTGCFPGAVLLVAKAKRVVHFEAYGYANLFDGSPMTRDTVFDLASLTKPLATTMAFLELAQIGLVDPGQPLASLLPQFGGTEKAGIRIRDLLMHTAGLPAWRPYFRALIKYDPVIRGSMLKQFLIREPLIHAPGKVFLYSDLGFMILAWVVEKITEHPLGRYIRQGLYRSLDLEKSFFFPSLDPIPADIHCAATELCPWRCMLINRVVHDDNAYSTADLQGHAGLFGSAMPLFQLLSVFLDAYRSPAEQRLPHRWVRSFAARQGKWGRALGFDVPSRHDSSSGDYFSADTIGHLGFTGTSFWVDLERAVIVILCTNRVHPSRHNNQIRAFRPRLHDTVMEQLGDSAR
ncbi:MAG: serine hydrolase [Deltaproteobacteria bacterium]|nr:MAG: serine hydrolase [Deltaproteobacteria bacterium]